MKILITGNMGYVGPNVVAQLRSSYPQSILIGYDIGYFANYLTNAEILPECLVDIQYFSDIRNFPAQLFEGVDAVVHLAAISNDPMGNRYEEITLDINYRASLDLAIKAKHAGVKVFVFASSCSVYGFAEEGAKTEQSEVNPLTAYARSKVFTEQGLQEVADNDFKVTCLRFATACGMSSRLRLDLVLNDFVAGAIISGKISILSDGTPWRPLVNVKDMARAIDWAIVREHSVSDDYLIVNAGSDNWNYQVRELAEAVANVIPGVEVYINPDAQPDKRSYKVNFDQFKTLAPEHQPKYGLKSTILELQNGLRSMGLKTSNFHGSQYIRLNALDSLRSSGIVTENLEWVFKQS